MDRYISVQHKKHPFAKFKVVLDNKKSHVERKTFDLLETLGFIGGVFAMITLLADYTIRLYNGTRYELSIIKKLYTLKGIKDIHEDRREKQHKGRWCCKVFDENLDLLTIFCPWTHCFLK